MTDFSSEEINLICLYDSQSRQGVIDELRAMLGYLMPDETELKALALRVITKLEGLPDEEFERKVNEWLFGWLPDDCFTDDEPPD